MVDIPSIVLVRRMICSVERLRTASSPCTVTSPITSAIVPSIVRMREVLALRSSLMPVWVPTQQRA